MAREASKLNPTPAPDSVVEELLGVIGPKAIAYLKRHYKYISHQDIEDIIAMSVSRAWLKYGSYDHEKAALEQWFSGIVINCTYDYLKKKFALHEKFVDLVDYPRIVSPEGTDQEDRSVRNAMLSDLIAIVESLPEVKRITVLRYAETASFEGRNTSEWTDGLDEVLGMTKSHIRQVGRRTLLEITSKMRHLGWYTPEGDQT